MVDAEDCLMLNRMNLGFFAREFAVSVALFERCIEDKLQDHRIIAARDGALNIYHFGCCLEAIKSNVALSPAHKGMVDHPKLRVSRRIFKREFPNIESVRHGIAHAAELYKTPADMVNNRQKMTGFYLSRSESVFVPQQLQGRTYSVGIDGAMFSVQLDQISVWKLDVISALNKEAFQAPVKPAEQQGES